MQQPMIIEDQIVFNNIRQMCEKHDIGNRESIVNVKIQQSGDTLKERLENFRTYLGEEMFSIIIGGGSASQLMCEWMVETSDNNIIHLRDLYYDELIKSGEKISREDVTTFIKIFLGSIQG